MTIKPQAQNSVAKAVPFVPELRQAELGRQRLSASSVGTGGGIGAAWKKLAFAGLVLLGGGTLYFGGSGAFNGPDSDAPNYKKHSATSVANMTPATISSADLDQKLTRQAIASAKKGTLPPELAQMHPALIPRIANGEIQFYTIKVWDTCAEDGDQVTISLNTGQQFGPILLTKAGKEIAIPVAGSQVPRIVMTAIQDGGGGVTVGVTTSTGVWHSAVMPVGGQQPIPLTVR